MAMTGEEEYEPVVGFCASVNVAVEVLYNGLAICAAIT